MAGTKQRILEVARELFAEQGVQKTSMREIADRLGITKPALYYHFSSREDLLRSIVQPLMDGGEDMLAGHETKSRVDPLELLTVYFDFHYRHRHDLVFVMNELTTLIDLGLVDLVLSWRARLITLLTGPEPTLEQSARVVVALGGLQDCVVQFRDVPEDELRIAAVTAACAALGIEKVRPEENRTGSPVV
ncbi:AcrR family transcriptional regulator [Kibdelosporangium banguiense]|uniref:AcrR family transcriptional regulator n=1 Tax=Kibdelosporangium banguiense TaxID=1365924 RepID=A0ABS4TJR9_9PSEU|nr:TetR/AcrR family transcriptional regulator [Kibdelosporangium banguiense]MBP2324658.1 AcrR family transcriptional regulator [Kibdelosporangium banguiense]